MMRSNYGVLSFRKYTLDMVFELVEVGDCDSIEEADNRTLTVDISITDDTDRISEAFASHLDMFHGYMLRSWCVTVSEHYNVGKETERILRDVRKFGCPLVNWFDRHETFLSFIAMEKSFIESQTQKWEAEETADRG